MPPDGDAETPSGRTHRQRLRHQASQRSCKTRVEDEHLRLFHLAGGDVDRPCGENIDQVERLEKPDVGLQCATRNPRVIRECRPDHSTAAARCDQSQYPRQLGKPLQAADVDGVTIDDLSKIVVVPSLPPSRAFSLQRLRIASRAGRLDVIRSRCGRLIADPTAPPNAASMNEPRRPASSPWLNECNWMLSARPASDSWVAARSSRLADPVTRNRPGDLSRSTAAFSAMINSGTR